MSDVWSGCGFQLVVEGGAYFQLTRNKPFYLEKAASEMAGSLFGEEGWPRLANVRNVLEFRPRMQWKGLES